MSEARANSNILTNKTIITLMLAVLMTAFAIFAFQDALLELVGRWHKQEEYSHGYLIPLISLYLLWSRRSAIAQSIGKPSWLGFGAVLLSAAMFIVGELGAIFLLAQIGFVVALIGIALALGGVPLLRVVLIPIIFLIFAIPLPYFVDSELSWRLQLISSQLGVWFIRLFNIPVFLDGNVIDLGLYKLQVVEACSGLRYLYPFMSLSFLAAYCFHGRLWQRALIFLSSIPITVVMNSLRIGLVGLLVDSYGPQEADGWLHFFEGWIIFMACAAILLLQMEVLARLFLKQSVANVFYAPVVKPAHLIQPRKTASYAVHAATAGALCVALVGGYIATKRQEILPPRQSFAGFPSSLGEWKGRASLMSTQTEHALGLTDYILSDYTRSNEPAVNFYVAYYASQRKGVSPHSPSVCIPGNGWYISAFQRTALDESGARFPINRVIIKKNAQAQLVYYWFEQRGRKIENEWLSKFYLILDALRLNRTDGALIRLTTPIHAGETDADADKRLQEFTRLVVPTLTAYLPTEAEKPVKSARLQGNVSIIEVRK